MFSQELGEASLLTTVGSVLPSLIEGYPGSFSVAAMIVSPEIDLLAAGVHELIAPKPGYYILGASLRWIIVDRAGPTATTPPTVRAGNNGSRTNVLASAVTPTMAQINSGLIPPFTIPSVAPQGTAMLLDLSSPLELEVTSPAVGPSILRGRIVLAGAFVRTENI